MNSGQPGKSSLLLRKARSEELDEIALLIKNAYMEYRDAFPPEHWESYIENIMDVRSRFSISELIVAELNRRIVGTVTLYLDASSALQERWPRGWASIRLLAVEPAYRGRGIGKALMEECVHRCRQRNIKTIGLHTVMVMGIARRIYESIGFVRAPEYDFYPRPGAVVMAYRLQL